MKVPGRRRRWRRRLVLAAVLLPLLLFGLSNLWLATPPGRSWIAGKVTRASGLEARVGPCSWLPWEGVCIRKLVIGRPPALVGEEDEPVLGIERIKVAPHWRELARGHVVIGRIEVEEPALDLPIELLAHLVAAPGERELPAVQAPDPDRAEEPVIEPDPGASEPPALAETAEAPPVRAPAAKVALPETSWLVVRGGRMRVRLAAGGGDWFSFGRIDAELPLRGKTADGTVAIGQITVAGRQVDDVEVPVRWESPRLSVTDWEPPAGPLQARVNAQCVLFASFPFAIECRLPSQSVGEAEDGAAGFSAGKMAGFASMGGHLRIPSTIVGRGGVEAEKVVVPFGFADETIEFDKFRLWGQLSGGVARVIDARAVGDRAALLGNAVVVADGRVGGVLRVVIPENGVEAISRRLGPELPEPPTGFRPLETRDRWFVDCALAGTIGAEVFRIGEGSWRPIEEALPMVQALLPDKPNR